MNTTVKFLRVIGVRANDRESYSAILGDTGLTCTDTLICRLTQVDTKGRQTTLG